MVIARRTAVTVVAGASSGLGFEAVKQLLSGSPPSTSYNVIIGARNVQAAQKAYNGLHLDPKHFILTHPLELSDLSSVKTFAERVLEDVRDSKLDILLLSAAISKAATAETNKHAVWSEAYRVNCIGYQYLMHLLQEKLESSKTRIAVVSSMLYKRVQDQDNIREVISTESQAKAIDIYKTTKFVQLLQTIRWKRILGDKAEIVAVSPGFVPSTGLSRETGFAGRLLMGYIMPYAPFATNVEDGGKAILRAMTGDLDLSTDEHVLLEKTGEWSELDPRVLDPALQEEWWLSKEDIERLL